MYVSAQPIPFIFNFPACNFHPIPPPLEPVYYIFIPPPLRFFKTFTTHVPPPRRGVMLSPRMTVFTSLKSACPLVKLLRLLVTHFPYTLSPFIPFLCVELLQAFFQKDLPSLQNPTQCSYSSWCTPCHQRTCGWDQCRYPFQVPFSPFFFVICFENGNYPQGFQVTELQIFSLCRLFFFPIFIESLAHHFLFRPPLTFTFSDHIVTEPKTGEC